MILNSIGFVLSFGLLLIPLCIYTNMLKPYKFYSKKEAIARFEIYLQENSEKSEYISFKLTERWSAPSANHIFQFQQKRFKKKWTKVRVQESSHRKLAVFRAYSFENARLFKRFKSSGWVVIKGNQESCGFSDLPKIVHDNFFNLDQYVPFEKKETPNLIKEE
ncbi:hypothetical protein SCLARK_00544 [Spiroplasma clarkii]|nr:hypothetical protein [Spiroplasma clarkii]ARU91226.1 hypothetical protein SCLARK_00544 [Spiroplasma clarkii]